MLSESQSVSSDAQSRLNELREENDALRAELLRAQRLATVGQMMSIVAHEFNNILTPIISYAQLARKNPNMIDKAIDRVSDGGARASDICRALLNLTRYPEQGPEEIDLAGLVEETLQAMARKPERDCIDLSVDVPDTLKVHAPRVDLQQVLLHLLINARNALIAKDGLRRLSLTARPDGEQVVLSVADTGVGIELDRVETIFEPFRFYPHSDKDIISGQGIGLAFCRETLRSIGGSIRVQSTPGQGARFDVSVPAAEGVPSAYQSDANASRTE
jgi:signal transduction histidine kinase